MTIEHVTAASKGVLHALRETITVALISLPAIPLPETCKTPKSKEQRPPFITRVTITTLPAQLFISILGRPNRPLKLPNHATLFPLPLRPPRQLPHPHRMPQHPNGGALARVLPRRLAQGR